MHEPDQSIECTLEDQIRLTLLAYADALFLPMDDHAGQLRTVVYERRQRFAVAGLAWSSTMIGGGVDVVTRKQVERATRKLEDDRQIAAANPARQRTACLKLTDAGDDYARALCHLPTLLESAPTLQRLRDLETSPQGFDSLGMRWAWETDLGRFEYSLPKAQRQLAISQLEDLMLPAMVRGLARSATDQQRRACYCLTPAGRELVKSAWPAGADARPLPRPIGDAAEFYVARREAALSALAAATPEDGREIGSIPMPTKPILRGPAPAVGRKAAP